MEKVYGILWCSHFQVFRNRDINASHNIQDLLVKQLLSAPSQNFPSLRETAEAPHHTENGQSAENSAD